MLKYICFNNKDVYNPRLNNLEDDICSKGTKNIELTRRKNVRIKRYMFFKR